MAIMDLNICNLCAWKTVVDSYTITVEQNVTVQGRMHPENFYEVCRVSDYGTGFAQALKILEKPWIKK